MPAGNKQHDKNEKKNQIAEIHHFKQFLYQFSSHFSMVGRTSAPVVRIVFSPAHKLFLPCAQKAILYAGWRQLSPWRELGSLPYYWILDGHFHIVNNYKMKII